MSAILGGGGDADLRTMLPNPFEHRLIGNQKPIHGGTGCGG
jgi:hypothetical protein